MPTIELLKDYSNYAKTRKRMNVIMREFELSHKEQTIGLTKNETNELGAMRIVNALKDGYYC